MESTYFGFSSSQHDSAIAVVDQSGKLVFAQSNERQLKNKRVWNSVPDPLGVIESLLEKYATTNKVSAALSWSNSGLQMYTT